MYLKRMEMKGFKSFADNTQMIYNPGVTCVVGPNGSGKSNITDALRWVLGEQKVKTLRGSKMEDVIFNGTRHRKALGLAEVSLIFDNSHRFFDMDFSEVVITRRLYRSGDSEYLINGAVCRLKDVKELFVDTGMGTEGYSIIGQGRIDKILSHNPEDRRFIFEEAAGIVKYKSRKYETQKKLDSTQANMLRVQDIIDELNMRIEPLSIESEKAKKYLDFEKERNHLQIGHFVRIIDKYEHDIRLENDKKEEVLQKLLQIEQNEIYWNKKIEQIKDMLLGIEHDIQRSDNRILELTQQSVHIESKLTQILEREKFINDSKNRHIREKEVLNTSINNLRVELDNANNKEQDLSQLATDKREKWENIKKIYDESIKYINSEKKYLDNDKILLTDTLNNIEEERVEIARSESSFDSWMQRRNDIDKKNDDIDARIVDHAKKIAIAEYSLSNATQNREICSKEYIKYIEDQNILKNRRKEKQITFDDITNKIFESKKERQLLQDMENTFEGYEYSVKNLLKSCSKDSVLGHGVHGVVASLIRVPADVETAIEVVLGRKLQQVVTEDEKDVKRLINYLNKNKIGRVTFLPLTNISSNPLNIPDGVLQISGVIGTADKLVNCDQKYEILRQYLLCRTLVVEDYDTAIECLNYGKVGRSSKIKHQIVTLNGELFIPNGAISGGNIRRQQGVHILGRKRRIDDLSEIIKKEEVNKNKIHQIIDDIDGQILDLDKKIEVVEQNKKALDREIVMFEAEYNSVSKEKKKIEDEKEQFSIQREMILTQTTQLEDVLEKHRANIIVLTKQKEKTQEAIKRKSKEIDSLELNLQNIKQDLSTIEIEQVKIVEQYDFAKKECQRLSELLQTNIKNLEKLEDEQINECSEIELLNIEKTQNEDKKKQINDELMMLHEKKQDIYVKRTKYQSEYSNNKQAYETQIHERESNRQILHNQELLLAKMEAKKDAVISNLWEMHEMSLIKAREHKVDMEEKVLKARLNELQKHIKALGEVNISSIDEYNSVKERFDFLVAQLDDLVNAKQSLIKVISSIENEMINKFKDTFEVIKSNFNEIFGILFDGGHADVKLEDMENCLETGIEILAQPAGKKLQSLNLLSGGERAMTAIALLFAILKTRPTPFCILDEIEAALDDVNVYKFANFLRGFVDNSQFVIITHRKGTMEIADTLYGVTMEEYGVSKLVSVKLEDYKEA